MNTLGGYLRKVFLVLLIVQFLVTSNFQPKSVQAQGEDGLLRQFNVSTGRVSFIASESGEPVPAVQALSALPGVHPKDPAWIWAAQYAPEFGIGDPSAELTAVHSNPSDDGRVTVRYQQQYQGVPVIGGELIVNTNDNGDLYSLNGEISPELTLLTQPKVDPEQARQLALQAMAKWYKSSPGDFVVSQPELWIFDEKLLQPSVRPVELVWRMEVTPVDEIAPIRELILINAMTGNPSLHFNQIDAAWQFSAKIGTPQISKPVSTHAKYPLAQSGGTWYVASNGSDSNSCSSSGSPCATINAAIGKASPADMIKVAIGTYTGTGSEVVLLNKSVTLSGGWSAGFSVQSGKSIIDGQSMRRGIMNSNGIISIIDRFVVQNCYTNDGTGGAGVYNNGGTITIEESTISGNDGGYSGPGGGIVNVLGGALVLNSSTVSGNKVNLGEGGGIINGYQGTITLNNSTVSGNTTNFAGSGIYMAGGTLTANNSTIYGNSSSYVGSSAAGISNASGGSIIIKNTIIAGNTSPTNQGSDCEGNITSLGHNLIGNYNSSNCLFTPTTGDNVGPYYSPIDPLLTPLQDNGGPTFTHALMAGSPAIDAGNIAAPGSGGNACLSMDQRGTSRPIGTRCDIGAYEGTIQYSVPYLVNTYTSNGSTTLPGIHLCNQMVYGCTNGSNLHADAAHKYAIGTYNFYATRFSRDSIDGHGANIVSTVHYSSGYQNAFWDGAQIVYGDAFGYPLADDIVGHEFSHGVTQTESGLFYYYQSGAINESFSDVFGEYFDQTNGLGNDTLSAKWLVGEDIVGLGAFRNMSNPPAFGDPDRMSSLNYYLGSDDNGGVHYNSGVNNKAAFLMVDGGTFNGKTVTALGWEKTAAIYYEVQTNLLASGADYSDLYYAIQRACTNLLGQKGITSANCVEVKDALDAVEMNEEPAGASNREASFCPTGRIVDPKPALFTEDFESSLTKWTISSAWRLGNFYAVSPVHMIWGDDSIGSSVSTLATQSGIYIPLDAMTFIHFKHAFGFEYDGATYYDGGVFEYSSDGGVSWLDAAPLFSGGTDYTGSLYDNVLSSNVLKGRSGFVGESQGYTSTRYDLSPLAGKFVKFRWRFATDQYYYDIGWYVDDVNVYACVPALPTLLSPTKGILINDRTPAFAWSHPVSPVDHYQLQLDTDDTFSSPIYTVNINVPEYTVPSNLSINTGYFWRVRTYDTNGATNGWSAVGMFRIPFGDTNAVTPANAATPLSLRPTFDWTDVTGAGHYKLQISRTSNFAQILTEEETLASTVSLTEDLPPGEMLYWRVRAEGTNGPSKWTDPRWFTTPNPPGDPTLKSPAENATISDSLPLFKWNRVIIPRNTTLDHYQIQVSTDAAFASLVVNASVADSMSPAYAPESPFALGKTYYWRVQALNTDGEMSGWSDVNVFRISGSVVNNRPGIFTLDAALPAPVAVFPSTGVFLSPEHPLLNWSDVPDATGYIVQASSDPEFRSSLLVSATTVNSEYLFVSDAPTDTLIYWRVLTMKGSGFSIWSQTYSFQVQ